jgi:predicted O-linked N-acetylglucosamine transferase (SPINDLY family)
MDTLSKQAYQYLQEGNYCQGEKLYQQVIKQNPQIHINYCYLGLVLLLQEKELEAKNIWDCGFKNVPEIETNIYLEELTTILKDEIEKQEELKDDPKIWLIRKGWREMIPHDYDNLLNLIQLSINLDLESETLGLIKQLEEILNLEILPDLSFELLLKTIINILIKNPQSNYSEKILNFCYEYGQINQLWETFFIKEAVDKIKSKELPNNNLIKIKLIETIVKFNPDNSIENDFLDELIPYYQDSNHNVTVTANKAITLENKFIDIARNTAEKILAYYLAIRGTLQRGNDFTKAQELYNTYQSIVKEFIENNSQNENVKNTLYGLILASFYANYFKDNPKDIHLFRGQLSRWYQEEINYFHQQTLIPLVPREYNPSTPLRIAYLSECFGQHSVGYLARWLLNCHDKNKFEIYTYSLKQRNDLLQPLINKITNFQDLSKYNGAIEIANKIRQDKIDILVDLDSLTSILCCNILCLKVAPIQVSWLGFDASGIPNVDYFIGDPYVLADNAQDYYNEKIWRLPHTYLAIGGFEVGLPTWRRADLGIPDDAIIYFSSQTGYKRHPDNIRLQMKIIKGVPNSYFLIKGPYSDQVALKKFFGEIALSEGVSPERLIFVDNVATSGIHRANLAIADVILDTYPYNGATTTLETLWMGVPMVTQVGEQFSARNSYTMMVNAGITEGIAWTPQEYVEWGIKLGLDGELRKKIHFKMKKSRQTSPLWDAKKFTQEMEKAYSQMWINYCQQENNPQTQEYLAYQKWQNQEYEEAENLYFKLIEVNPQEVRNYWYLGLIQLLQGKEIEAQSTWLSVLMDGDEKDYLQWSQDLKTIICDEIETQTNLGNQQIIWVIRNHLREIFPEDFDNLLWLIQLSCELRLKDETKNLVTELSYGLQFNEEYKDKIDFLLLFQTLKSVLEDHARSETSDILVNLCINYGEINPHWAKFFIEQTYKTFQQDKFPRGNLIKVRIIEVFWHFQQNHIDSLETLIPYYQDIGNHEKSILLEDIYLEIAPNLKLKTSAYYFKLRGLLQRGGNFELAKKVHQEYLFLIKSMMENPQEFNNYFRGFLKMTSYAPYLEDNPREIHLFRGKFSRFIQENLQRQYSKEINREISTEIKPHKPLKIGYISECFGIHSVGFLSRFLFQYHNRQEFEIYTYSLQIRPDPLQSALKNITNFNDVSSLSLTDVVNQIRQDHIDILIDLDSLTSSIIAEIMALKCAPIQVTWLGFDAADNPAIDYFIADPYVLPENAQEYYQEKIWRLPHNYIGIDGFEVGIPSWRRDELGIPEDGIVYFSSQTGYKRNSENIRLQMKIIKAVPNSYFLIKGPYTDENSLKKFFEDIAFSEGVLPKQLIFLGSVANSEIHRANLAIADVILDTYPYNGATTTLETLWMGVPMVTQVGEQFSARNSYTMMVNAGITEGIAWTPQEYVEWGIKLGLDGELRKKIHFKLKKSRQTSLLWNGKQFTIEMEKAYRQMWINYCEKKIND